MSGLFSIYGARQSSAAFGLQDFWCAICETAEGAENTEGVRGGLCFPWHPRTPSAPRFPFFGVRAVLCRFLHPSQLAQ